MTALDEFERLRKIQDERSESHKPVPHMDALILCELVTVLKEQYNPVQEKTIDALKEQTLEHLDRISVLEERYNELKEHYTTLYVAMQLQADIVRSLLEKVDTLKNYLEDTNHVHGEQIIKVSTKQTEHEGTLASHKRAIDEMKESIGHIFHIIR